MCVAFLAYATDFNSPRGGTIMTTQSILPAMHVEPLFGTLYYGGCTFVTNHMFCVAILRRLFKYALLSFWHSTPHAGSLGL